MFANSFTVIYDACLIYSPCRRDHFMRLAMSGLFRAKWTSEIHEEWMRAFYRKNPHVAWDVLIRTRDLMNKHAPDCLVTGHMQLVESLSLPDPNDRHVLAAAICAKADAIVTLNLKHFPDEILSRYELEAIHPDKFLLYQLSLSLSKVCSAVRAQRESLKRNPLTVDQMLENFSRNQLTLFAAEFANYKEIL